MFHISLTFSIPKIFVDYSSCCLEFQKAHAQLSVHVRCGCIWEGFRYEDKLMHKCWQTHANTHTLMHTHATRECNCVYCVSVIRGVFCRLFRHIAVNYSHCLYACVARRETFAVAMPPPISSSQFCFCFRFRFRCRFFSSRNLCENDCY